MTPTFDPPKDRCGICESPDVALFVTDYKGITIFRCRNCGVQFMNPQYTDAHLQEYYSHFTIDEPKWEEPLFYGHDFYLSLLERHAPNRGKILDIGAGNGYALVAAKRRGWDPVGYDVDADSERRVSERIGVKILCGDFLKMDWKPASFDAVYMHQVIEHLKNPKEYFQTIHRLLKPNGTFFIAQPNIHAGAALVKSGLERLGLRQNRRAAHYGTEGHLWYDSVDTMEFALNHFGFEPLYVRSCHKVRPNQSKIKRWFLRTVVEVLPWKSAFLVIARKKN